MFPFSLQKSTQSGSISTNPLAKLAAACTSLCNDMKPKNCSPGYASSRNQFSYPVSSGNHLNPVSSGQQLPVTSTLLSHLSALQSQQQPANNAQKNSELNYLLAHELLAKQQSTGLALETLAALQAQNQQISKPFPSLNSFASGSNPNLEHLTKVYLQTLAAKRELTQYPAFQPNSLDLLVSPTASSTEKLLSPSSTSHLLQSNGSHLHNGIDYRLCPCAACQTLRLNLLSLQQQLAKTTNSTVSAPDFSAPLQPQQHYLMPQKNPITGSIQYVSICSDSKNCSLCTKPTNVNNNYLQQPSAISPTGLTAEQYLAALSGHVHQAASNSSKTPSPKPGKVTPDFSSPLQISTSPSPTIQEIVPSDITCSWTENGTPCGHKFASEDQLFDHIKKVHTSNQTVSSSQPSVPKQASPLNSLSGLTNDTSATSPLVSLKNLSRKVLPEPVNHHSLSASRFHPYSRPALHDSRLQSLTNQIAARQAAPTLPLLSSAQLSLGSFGALGLPSVAPQPTPALPFSFSTNGSSQFASANQMSSLLFAAAAR